MKILGLKFFLDPCFSFKQGFSLIFEAVSSAKSLKKTLVLAELTELLMIKCSERLNCSVFQLLGKNSRRGSSGAQHVEWKMSLIPGLRSTSCLPINIVVLG